MLGSASSCAYGSAPSKNDGCGCRGQPELDLTAAVAAQDSGEEQMIRYEPSRSTGALDSGRSTPKSQSPGPYGTRPHPRRQINVDLSQLARVNISTLPSLGKETDRVCPTLHLVGNASVRQYGRCERAAHSRPRLSYPLEHQSPGPTL